MRTFEPCHCYSLRVVALLLVSSQALCGSRPSFNLPYAGVYHDVGTIATDDQGRVSFLNPIAERLTGTGLEEARGKKIGEVFPIFSEATNNPVENPVDKVLALGSVVGLGRRGYCRLFYPMSAGRIQTYNLGNCVVSHPPPIALTNRTLASIRRR